MPSMGSWGVPGRGGVWGVLGGGGSQIRLLRMFQVRSWGALYGFSGCPKWGVTRWSTQGSLGDPGVQQRGGGENTDGRGCGAEREWGGDP